MARADEGALISPAVLAERLHAGQVSYLLDVRTPEEFAEGHIHGAINIPVQALASRIDEVPVDVPVVVYCRSGRRAQAAASLLRARGQVVTELDGSMLAWRAAGFAERTVASAPSPCPGSDTPETAGC